MRVLLIHPCDFPDPEVPPPLLPPNQAPPLGLAYIAVTNGEQTREMEMRLPPRRVTIKRRIPNQALIELRRLVEETG